MRITERGVLIAATALLFGAGTVFVITGEAVLQSGSGGWAFLLWAPGFGLCGAIVTRRYPRHAVGRLLLWAGLSSGLLAAWFFGALGGQFGAFGEAVGSVLWLFPFMLVFAAIARFPNGAWSSPWAARFLWTFVVALGVQVPLGYIDRSDAVLASDVASSVSALAGLGLVAAVIVHLARSMRSDPVQRRQFGWILLGLGITAAAWSGLGAASGVPDWLGPASFLVFPATLVVAITRYKLYEIDRIVSRTVSYVVVIGVLGAVYAGLVLALRSVVPVEGPLPVALSTLAVAFGFFPLLRRVQEVVDRRFFRSRYDAAGVVAAFADELRSTLDPEVAAGRAEAVVEETFQAESVSVWLAQEPA